MIIITLSIYRPHLQLAAVSRDRLDHSIDLVEADKTSQLCSAMLNLHL